MNHQFWVTMLRGVRIQKSQIYAITVQHLTVAMISKNHVNTDKWQKEEYNLV